MAKGSTTATMVFLKNGEQMELKTSNIGDSGYMLLRPKSSPDGSVSLQKLFRSESQQHYFNCPFQIGNHNKSAPSKQAFETSHAVNPEDILVLGTDGLWDNLFDEDVITLIEKRLGA